MHITSASRSERDRSSDETGSVITEYGLIAILGATIASIVVKWATGGAIFELFGAVAAKVRSLLGA